MTRLVFLCLLFGSLPAWAAGVRVVNVGIGGQNSAEGRARFAHDVLEEKPAVLLLYFGMNDVANEPKFLPLEEYLANMAWMIDQARAHGIVPVVATIQHVDVAKVMTRHKPESYGAEGVNGKIDRYDAALVAMLKQKKVAVADFRRALDEAGGPTAEMSTDGTHLTPTGYRLLAQTFFATIPLGVHGTVVCLGDSLTAGVPLKRGDEGTYPVWLEKMLR